MSMNMQHNCLNIVMHSDTLFFFCVPDWWTWTTAARKCHLYFPLETKPNQSQSVSQPRIQFFLCR